MTRDAPEHRITQNDKLPWIESVSANRALDNLSARAAVLMMTRFRNRHTEVACPSIETLARLLGSRPDSVRRSIRGVERAGYIWRQPGTGRGPGNSTQYWFTWPVGGDGETLLDGAIVGEEHTPKNSTCSAQRSSPPGPAFDFEESGPERMTSPSKSSPPGTPNSGPNGATNPLSRTHKKDSNNHSSAREGDLFGSQQLPVLVPKIIAPSSATDAVELAIAAYNAIASGLNWVGPVRQPLADKRKRALLDVLKRIGLGEWIKLLEHARGLPFFDCTSPRPGKNGTSWGWRADIDLIMRKADKIREGGFDQFDPRREALGQMTGGARLAALVSLGPDREW